MQFRLVSTTGRPAKPQFQTDLNPADAGWRKIAIRPHQMNNQRPNENPICKLPRRSIFYASESEDHVRVVQEKIFLIVLIVVLVTL
jgi:hypothetical protein